MKNTSAPKPVDNRTAPRPHTTHKTPARPISKRLSTAALQALLQPHALVVMPNVGLVRVAERKEITAAGATLAVWCFTPWDFFNTAPKQTVVQIPAHRIAEAVRALPDATTMAKAHSIMAASPKKMRGTSSTIIDHYTTQLKSCDALRLAEIVRDFRHFAAKDIAYSFYESLQGALQLLAHYDAHLHGGLTPENVSRCHAALIEQYAVKSSQPEPTVLGASPLDAAKTKAPRRRPK